MPMSLGDAMRYEAVIGLEVHTQLLTASKIFCGCGTRFGAPANSQTCPICLGMPGVLPVLNREVVALCIRAGLATHCKIAPFARFARKNYFYPDLPKGYQISMYELPLAEGGYLDIPSDGQTKRICVKRIHMEEDAGKNLHEGIAGGSHVDLNRAGVPLIEIVSDPDLRSSAEAIAYLKRLHEIIIYAGVSDGDMEKGNFRCDANISLRPLGTTALGTRVEIKNVNSFRFIQKALEYEMDRQARLLDSGGIVVQETRLWDAKAGATQAMRGKEEAHDYRYFPEPDLVPLRVDPAWIAEVRAALPELPDAKRERFVAQYGLPEYDAEILTGTRILADFFEETAALYPHPKKISNWVMGVLLREMNREDGGTDAIRIPPAQMADLLTRVETGALSANGAKTVFERMYQTGERAEEAAQALGITQVNDLAELERIVDAVLAACPKEVARYRAGEAKLIGFFVGQAMKQSRGKGNPARLNALFVRALSPAEPPPERS